MKGRPHTYCANCISECSGHKQQWPGMSFATPATCLSCVADLSNPGACAHGGGQ